MAATYLHNPRCRKSREGLELLQKKGLDIRVREYLNDPLDKGELTELASMLGDDALRPASPPATGAAPGGWIRTGEPEFKDHFKGKELPPEQWIEAIERFPKLLERPILIHNGKAAIGRPPENLLSIL